MAQRHGCHHCGLRADHPGDAPDGKVPGARQGPRPEPLCTGPRGCGVTLPRSGTWRVFKLIFAKLRKSIVEIKNY